MKPIYFTREMHFTWLSRTDVRDKLLSDNADEETAHREFVAWWILFGKREYHGNDSITPEAEVIARETVNQHGSLAISRVMNYLMRCASESPHSLSDLIPWYYVYGVPEYDLFQYLSNDEFEYLRSPSPELEQDTSMTVSRLMHWLWLANTSLQMDYDLTHTEGRERYLAWFIIEGLNRFRLMAYLNLDDAILLYQPAPMFDPELEHPITRLMWYHFLITHQEGRSRSLMTSESRKVLLDSTNTLLYSQGKLSDIWDLLHSRSEKRRFARYRGTRRTTEEPNKSFGDSGMGVNLVGYALGELGIGEDVRMLAQSLMAVGVDFCILNRQPNPEIRQLDFSVARHLSEIAKYPITIICMTAFDTAMLWLDWPDLLASTYVIGYWPWELPDWPNQWDEVYQLVDEIWVSSHYTFNAFAPRSPVPIHVMPMAVTLNRRGLPNPHPKLNFLPRNRFLFLFVFDYMSYPARKNPLGCVNAFLSAFPRGDEPVNLVLKMSNVNRSDPKWVTLSEALSGDPRIIRVQYNMNKDHVISLMNACDAYVSLHRAEGFGRTLAEAMLLKKPVIATGYSGNADFLTDATGYPVDYRLTDIAEDEYPYSHGQTWAEPDVDSAACRMRDVFMDQGQAKARAASGHRLISARHAPRAVGRKVLRRLKDIIKTRR